MKIDTNKKKLFQEWPKLLLVLGVIASIFAPSLSALAQKPPIQIDGILAPLSPQLSWNDLGQAERTFEVNGSEVTLAGNAYGAVEEFNYEAREDVAEYYATPGMEEKGWKLVDSQPQKNGVLSIYYHESGIYALVEFAGCEDAPALACLTVWASETTELAPQFGAPDPEPQAVTFVKTYPANNATGIASKPTLTWAAYTGTKFGHYRYCIDQVANSNCDATGGWTSVWSGTSVTVTLAVNNVYYWQVEAVLTDNSKVGADSGTWWAFSTGSGTATPTGTITATPTKTSTPTKTATPTEPPSPPIAFVKTLPADNAVGQSTTPVLAWGSSTYATSYSYCIDTVDNNLCDTNWVSNGSSTFITLVGGLTPNYTYYWQVRATNPQGTVEGNGTNVWWEFTTSDGPPNDTINNATDIPVAPPYQIIPLNTAAATVDTGTGNSCSNGLGFASVWYKYVATDNRKIYLDTYGSNYDTFIAVWKKNVDDSLTLLTCNDNAPGSYQSAVSLSVTNTMTYYIQVAQRNPNTTPLAAPGGTLKFQVKNFADVKGNSAFWPYIEGIYAEGITGGCSTSPDLLFCPTQNVSRAQMAVFLVKAKHGTAYTPPDATGLFDDVPASHWAADYIEQLVADGITAGCGGGNYCPDAFVTRAEMAVFLLTANGVVPGLASGAVFDDVPLAHWAAKWIEELHAQGITGGCDASNYCPDEYVTREQMAVFLSVTFGIAPLP
ncbi:MAG: S-layer homology domain-containing protein [Chloroflexota bacterium]